MDSWTCGRGSVVLSARHSLSNHQTLPPHGTERLKGFSRTKNVAVCGGGGAVRVVDCGQAKAVRARVRWLGIRHTVVVYSLSLTQRPPCHLRPRRCFYLNLLLPDLNQLRSCLPSSRAIVTSQIHHHQHRAPSFLPPSSLPPSASSSFPSSEPSGQPLLPFLACPLTQLEAKAGIARHR